MTTKMNINLIRIINSQNWGGIQLWDGKLNCLTFSKLRKFIYKKKRYKYRLIAVKVTNKISLTLLKQLLPLIQYRINFAEKKKIRKFLMAPEHCNPRLYLKYHHVKYMAPQCNITPELRHMQFKICERNLMGSCKYVYIFEQSYNVR